MVLCIYSRPPCISSTRAFLYQEVAQLIMVIPKCMEVWTHMCWPLYQTLEDFLENTVLVNFKPKWSRKKSLSP